MNLVLKNFILNKEITYKYLNYFLINRIILKTPVNIYFNTKNSDGLKYINKKKKNTLFIAGCGFNRHIPDKKNMYFFITNNSWNPQLSFTKKITEKEFQNIQKYLKFNPKYQINPEGYIYIFLNNSVGWFQNSLVKPYYANIYIELLEKLIKNIRSYTNRKIKVRLHPTDKKTLLEIKIKNLLLTLNKCEYSNEDISLVFKNIYCAFIQNSKLIIDLVNLGIPIFNLGFIKCNYFPEIQVTKIEIINNLKDLPNRKEFLMKYYFHLNFDLLDNPKNFIFQLNKFNL